MSDPLNRFSNRAENYAKYRPGYPPGVIQLLKEECDLTRQSVIADVGSGTGILSELFLKNGNTVFAIEPNSAMRAFAERAFTNNQNFVSLDTTAEQTNLPNQSVDFVVAAQAFHWFDRQRARAEFARILRPNGWVVLIWNERKVDSTPFLRDYEELLLRFGTDYPVVRPERVTADIAAFFYPDAVEIRHLANTQHFDLEALKGRLLSSSYTPIAGDPSFVPMLEKLKQIFTVHQENGGVTFEYQTQVYFGHLRPPL